MTAASTDGAQSGSPTKGDRARRRILDAAAAEVARHGRAGASLTAIATAAGLKPGSVYFHFASREQLIDAMVEEGLRESLARLDRAIAEVTDPARPGDPRARLRAAIRAHLDALQDLHDYAVVVLASAVDLEGPPAARFRALRRSYVHQWTELIEDAQRAGVVAPGPAARTVRDLLVGALNYAGLSGHPPAETAAAVEALIMIPSEPA
jgi:AcrR family transcriptional regulator